MSLISLQNKRTLIMVFITLLVVFETITYVTTTPRPAPQYFQLYVLGSNGKAADYYPNTNSTISPNEEISWYLGSTNFMGNLQLVDVRVKLGNQTINPPNDQQALPSPAPLVTEFQRFTQENETWEIPFIWAVTNVKLSSGVMRILSLEIDNETYQISNWTAANGHDFRLIFELWTWDTNTSAFQFGWETNGEHPVAWLQIWFNMTTTSAPLQYQ